MTTAAATKAVGRDQSRGNRCGFTAAKCNAIGSSPDNGPSKVLDWASSHARARVAG